MVKNPPALGRRHKGCGFNPWVGKIPWSKAWQPTPLFLPGESHGQRSLGGYSPWGGISFRISPSNEYSGLISFRIDWFDLLAVQWTLKSLLQHRSSKASIFQSPPGSSVHGISQARIMEWVAMPSSRGLLHPWDFPGVSTGVGCHCCCCYCC